MDFLVKLLISNVVIVVCVQLGKRLPSLAGLVATMPLAGLVVLVWLYAEKGGDPSFMVTYTRGALWGILPSIAFYVVAFICFSRHFSLPVTLSASFAVWAAGAVIHQKLLT